MKRIITHIPLTSWLTFIGATLVGITLPFSRNTLTVILSLIAAVCYILAMFLAVREYRASQRQWKQADQRLEELMRRLKQ